MLGQISRAHMALTTAAKKLASQRNKGRSFHSAAALREANKREERRILAKAMGGEVEGYRSYGKAALSDVPLRDARAIAEQRMGAREYPSAAAMIEAKDRLVLQVLQEKAGELQGEDAPLGDGDLVARMREAAERAAPKRDGKERIYETVGPDGEIERHFERGPDGPVVKRITVQVPGQPKPAYRYAAYVDDRRVGTFLDPEVAKAHAQDAAKQVVTALP